MVRAACSPHGRRAQPTWPRAAVEQHGNITDAQHRDDRPERPPPPSTASRTARSNAGRHARVAQPVGERTALHRLAAFVLDCGAEAIASGPSRRGAPRLRRVPCVRRSTRTVCAGASSSARPSGPHDDRAADMRPHPRPWHRHNDRDPCDHRCDPVRQPGDAHRCPRRCAPRPRLTEDMLHERIAELRSRGGVTAFPSFSRLSRRRGDAGGHTWLEPASASRRCELPRPDTNRSRPTPRAVSYVSTFASPARTRRRGPRGIAVAASTCRATPSGSTPSSGPDCCRPSSPTTTSRWSPWVVTVRARSALRLTSVSGSSTLTTVVFPDTDA